MLEHNDIKFYRGTLFAFEFIRKPDMDQENKANAICTWLKCSSHRKKSESRAKEKTGVQQRHQSSSLNINSSTNFTKQKKTKTTNTQNEQRKQNDNVLKFVHLARLLPWGRVSEYVCVYVFVCVPVQSDFYSYALNN